MMVNTADIKAARKFGPGTFIREQMELREWTQEELAEVTGFTIKHINKILTNKQAITLDMAKVLGQVFNTSAQYWINIDTDFRLWASTETSSREKDADLKGIIYERMPVKDMIKKGWIKPFSNTEELKQRVLDFWGWEKLEFESLDKESIRFVARKSEAFNQFNASYALTWFRKAAIESKRFKVPAFNRPKLVKLYDDIHNYTIDHEGINRFIKALADVGVIFFVLPHLQKTYLDGAAFYSGNNPVIVYTGRYKRIDNFWFTIAHEIAHVLNHLKNKDVFILDDFGKNNISAIEKEANELAAIKLKHAEIEEFLNPYLHYITSSKVEECAVEYGIHPSIIVGKLAHEKKISYSNQHLYNEDVLGIINKKYQV